MYRTPTVAFKWIEVSRGEKETKAKMNNNAMSNAIHVKLFLQSESVWFIYKGRHDVG